MVLNPQFLETLSRASKELEAAHPSSFGGVRPLGTVNPATMALSRALISGNGLTDLHTGSVPMPTQAGKSVISRVLDVLSRPLYATADAAYESEDALANHQSFMDQIKGLGTGIVHGFSGTEKRTWDDIIQQGKDINDQKAKTGDTAGYQFGQSGDLSTGDKVLGLGMNIFLDPSLKTGPIPVARKVGDVTGLYKIPTFGDLAKKVLTKNSFAGEAEQAASNEAGPSVGSKILDINPQALSKAKSIPEVISSKIGEPIQVNVSHPHVNFDEQAISEGKLKPTGLTEEGQAQARAIHPQIMTEARQKVASRINDLMKEGMSLKEANNQVREWANGIFNEAAKPSSAVARIGNNAIHEVANDSKGYVEHNQKWISEAVKNGVDPERAVQVVKDVQSGADFKTAFEDAVKNSKPLRATNRIIKSSEANGLTDPHFKLSSILAPTAREVLDGVHPQEANAVENLRTIQQTKALNEIKRAGAVSRPLDSAEQAVHDDVANMARNKVDGTGGFKPTGAYNDLAQSMVWNTVRGRLASITHGGAQNVRAINERTLKVVAHIEQTLESEGIKPVAGDGTPARITEAVLNHSEFPSKLKNYPNHILNNYVNGTTAGSIAKAENAVDTAEKMKPPIQQAALRVNEIFKDPNLSDPVKHLASQETAKGVERSILMSTGSTRAAAAGKTIYKAIIANQDSAAKDAITRAGTALREIVSTGKIPENYQAVVNRLGEAVSRSLSSGTDIVQAPRVLGTLIGPEARAETGFLGRMATWFGQHDLRPIVRARQATSRTNAALWTNYWNDTFRNLTSEQRVEAMRVAQGVFIGSGNPDVARAAEMIRTRFENLLSSSRISESARTGNTVAMRAGLVMEGKYGLNAELKRMGSQLKLTNKSVKVFDETRDYSKGTDWLNSWEAYSFKGDPAKEMGRIESAIWNASAKKAVFDDIISRFGTPTANAERNFAIKDFAPLKGNYFSEEIAQQIPRVIRDLYDTKPQSGALLRSVDNIMRLWKTSVTIYSPSHAIHNGIGDIYNNWIAGVNDVRNYSRALRVMRAFHTNYQGLEGLRPIFNSMQDLPTELAKLSPEVSGKDVVVATKDGQKLTAAQIYMAAHNQGILQAVQHIEDIYDENGGLGGLTNIKPFGGKVNAAAHSWVQGMDHFTRLAQFIHEVKNGSGEISEIFAHAGQQVRKFHPDGMDLTDFERTVLRRVIPFYSWTRKAIPFTVVGMLEKPGKFLVYPKITTQLNLGGASNISIGQQFPSDQLFPSWITDEGIGPIGKPGGFLNQLIGGPSGYVTTNLPIPPIDLLQNYGNHPNQGILSGLNPLIKDPLELMEGHTLDTQVPIQGVPQYLGQNVPIASLFQNLTNVGLGGVDAKGQQQGIGNQQAFVNFLTGLKLTDTGQYIKEAQYELHQKQTLARKANRNNLQQFLQSLNGV